MNRLPARVVGFFRKGFSPIHVIAMVALVAILGVGGYFAFNVVSAPARVKEKVSIAHPIFLQYKQSIDKIVDHLEDEGDSDSDSLERAAKKAEDLVKQAETEQASLKEVVKTMTIGDLSTYQKKLNDYLAVSEKIIDFEKDNGMISEAYVGPIKDYEDLTVKLSGASNFLYSDPDKYLSLLNSGISDEEAIVAKIKKVETKHFGKYNDQFLTNLSDEINFLKSISEAVENRRTGDIAVASQKFAADSQQNTKTLNRIVEQLNDDVKSLADSAKSDAEQINNEYNRLRSKFNF